MPAMSIALAVVSPIAIPAALDPGGLSGRPAMYALYTGCMSAAAPGTSREIIKAYEHAERRRRRGRFL
jgi:hypothetical protein